MSVLAVLGTGNVGVALAADLGRRGHRVSLWGRTPTRYQAILQRGVVDLHDGADRVEVPVRACAELRDTVRGAETIFISIPAHSQVEVVTALAPHIAGEQAVVFIPGNLITPWARFVFAKHGRSNTLVETSVPPFASRRAGDSAVVIIVRARSVPAASLGSHTQIEAMASVFPQTSAADDVIDAFLLNPTYVIHPALTVTNAGAVEHFYPDPGFDVQAQGTTAATRRVIDAVDDERIRVRKALGYGAPHFRQATSYYSDQEEGLFGTAALEAREIIALYKKPMNLDHRYVNEDVAVNLVSMSRLGAAVRIATPVVDSLVALGGVLVGRRLRGDERHAALPTGCDELLAVVST